MYLLEIAAQGVRGFSATSRAALKPGYLVLKPPSNATPLAGLALAILYADGRGGDAAFLASGQKLGRIGFTVLGQDQTTYRVVRDLGGPGALHRLNKATQQFEVLTEDAAEMG